MKAEETNAVCAAAVREIDEAGCRKMAANVKGSISGILSVAFYAGGHIHHYKKNVLK